MQFNIKKSYNFATGVRNISSTSKFIFFKCCRKKNKCLYILYINPIHEVKQKN